MTVPDDAALAALIDLAYDHACARPLGDLVDIDRLLAAVETAATPERLGRWQDRLLLPLRARLLARAGASAVPLSAWLPDDVAAAVAEILGEPAPLPRKMVAEVVASEKVREGVRAMLQETLTGFVGKVVGGEGEQAPRGGLRGALGWGARAVVASGKGLLGGLGEEFQKQLQDRARDFVDGAVGSVQARIVERMTSEDTAKALGKRRRRWFEGTLRKTEAEATRGLRKAPFARLDPLVPRVIAHNLARTELRDALRDELAAALAELSREPLGALLDDAGLREALRAGLHARGLPWLRSLVATPGFGTWWSAGHPTE